jgi:glycosyltransferase involved in cell wall biosynthesis
MNLLVVSEYFYPRLAGGEIVSWHVCTTLARRGHKIYVVTSKMGGTSEHEIKAGIDIYRPFPSGQSLLKRIIFVAKLYLYLEKFLKLNKVDIVYNFAYIATLPATFQASKHGIPSVTAVHSLVGRDWFRLTNPAVALVNYSMERLILRFGRHRILQFPSEDTRKKVQGKVATKTVVIANPIETDLVACVKAETDPLVIRKSLGIEADELFLLFVGSLLPVKNVTGLVGILSRLERRFKLAIVGEGPERDKIVRLVKRYGLGNKVILLGRKSHKDTLKLMASCDVLILPSRSEVSPMVIFETIAIGRPVITTRVGCTSDIRSNNLYLVDSLEQINELLRAGIKPQAEEGFAQRFAPDRIASELESLFASVIVNKE